MSVENSRLVEALQQARNRIHKLEAAADNHDSDVAARLQNVRNAEEKVCHYDTQFSPSLSNHRDNLFSCVTQLRQREVELEIKSAKQEADLRTITSEETLQLQQDIHQVWARLLRVFWSNVTSAKS